MAAVAASSAIAQSPPPSPKQACRASAMSLCSAEALSHDRSALRACMIRNFDKLTPDCQAALKAAEAARESKATPRP